MVKMIENYILKECIGEGSFGKVYKASHAKKQGDYAVKIIPAQKFQQNSKLQQCTFNEVKILSTIGLSNNIVRYYQMLKTKNNYYFIYQYCNGGTLLDKIRKDGPIPQKRALAYFQQLIEAFKVLNRCNIMHRDIKAENIFFHENCLKLGDFGFCKGLGPEENMAKTMLGSPIYMAPQVLKGQPYSTKADIWSLGVILYEMLYGVCPFQSNSIAMLINTINVTQVQFPDNPTVSQSTQVLIRKMLTKDYFRRIGWVQLFGSGMNDDKNQDRDKSPIKPLNMSYGRFRSQLSGSVQTKQPLSRIIDKKSPSISKQGKIQQKKVFYSQRYLQLMNSINKKPLEDNNNIGNDVRKSRQMQILNNYNESRTTTEIKHSSQQNNRIDNNNISLECYQLSNNKNNTSQKRINLLKNHQEIIQQLQNTIIGLQSGQTSSIIKAYNNLLKIRDILKQISSGIQITQVHLLDMSSIANYQLIQIDRLIVEVKQEMFKLKLEIPEVGEKDSKLSKDKLLPTIDL